MGTKPTEQPVSLPQTALTAQQDLDAATRQLAELREQIAAEKLPLTRELARAEGQLIAARADYERIARQLDTRNLDLGNLQNEIKSREEETKYLSNLLSEYVRNFETRVHVSELQRYQAVLGPARSASERMDLAPAEAFRAQAALVDASLDRLLDLVGGTVFEGVAVAPDGRIRDARFALVGPVALYAATDGSSAGLAEQRLGSLEPNMVPFDAPQLAAGVRAVIEQGSGRVPFDPSLGNAQKIEETRESLVEHIQKGGPVMVPILLMALAAMIVAGLKWIQISRIPNPPQSKVRTLLTTLERRDWGAAAAQAQALRGPTGEMIQAGVQRLSEPKELVEEVMFEKMLETRLRLQSFLPFVALSASAAPLLGLLGTVTGMINTFKLITALGTGDPKTLSSGISEALITTEFGLIVAIPALLLYAYLSRRAQRLIDGMEKTAISVLNRISTKSAGDPGSPMVAAAS